jgi:hypothetical protein
VPFQSRLIRDVFFWYVGINSFNLNDFKYIGVGNTSNTISTQSLVMESTGYINKFYNYDNSS